MKEDNFHKFHKRRREYAMTQGIYIVGAEPGSGKSVVALGMMEMLSGSMAKIGFFRPVVRDEKKPDNITRLIIKRYGLDLSYEKLYGCGYDLAQGMFSRNREEDLLKMILGKYRDLERECDLIVCAGTVKILIVPTDEEREIAQQTIETIKRVKG